MKIFFEIVFCLLIDWVESVQLNFMLIHIVQCVAVYIARCRYMVWYSLFYVCEKEGIQKKVSVCLLSIHSYSFLYCTVQHDREQTKPFSHLYTPLTTHSSLINRNIYIAIYTTTASICTHKTFTNYMDLDPRYRRDTKTIHQIFLKIILLFV